MKVPGAHLFAVIVGDRASGRLVPRTGINAWLVVFAAGAMAFLAVFALALTFTTERISQAWATDLSRAATVRIAAAPGQVADRTAAALRVLQTTPGVVSARALGDAEQRALLAPWLGPDLPLDRLPVPALIELTVDPAAYNAQALRLRLEGEVEGAVLDDHARWREPLIAAATRIRWLGIGASVLILAALAAMVTLAARATLASNAQVVEVLRLIGARDFYVARVFVRQITLRALSGAAAGAFFGGGTVALVPSAAQGTGLLSDFGFAGVQWLWLFALPFIAGAVALLSARAATMAELRRTA